MFLGKSKNLPNEGTSSKIHIKKSSLHQGSNLDGWEGGSGKGSGV